MDLIERTRIEARPDPTPTETPARPAELQLEHVVNCDCRAFLCGDTVIDWRCRRD